MKNVLFRFFGHKWPCTGGINANVVDLANVHTLRIWGGTNFEFY